MQGSVTGQLDSSQVPGVVVAAEFVVVVANSGWQWKFTLQVFTPARSSVIHTKTMPSPTERRMKRRWRQLRAIFIILLRLLFSPWIWKIQISRFREKKL